MCGCWTGCGGSWGWRRWALASLRGRSRRPAVERCIRVLVFNRLSDPESKLGVLRWLPTVCVPGVDGAEVTHARLLRAMDALWAGQAVLEQRLAAVLLPRFADALDLLFYDLTTVRIAGDGTVEGDLRRYGHSKDVRGADRQVAVGVVQTATGLPLTHEVFEGNVGEVTTVRGIIERLGQRFRLRRVIFVADRGMLSLDTLDLLEGASPCRGAVPSSTSSPSPPAAVPRSPPAWPLSIPAWSKPAAAAGRKAWRTRRWRMAGGWWWRTIPNGPGHSAASAPSGFGKCWCSRAPWKPSSRLRMPG